MKIKIRDYFNTYSITVGFFASLFGSLFIYLGWFELDSIFLETVSSILFFWLLLGSSKGIWFWSGFFLSIFWFWWIGVSFTYYHMAWAAPVSVFLMAMLYGFIFWLISHISNKFSNPYDYLIQICALLSISYLHPLGFNWFIPELTLSHTYLGVQKWQFAIVLAAIALSKWKKTVIFLPLVLLAYTPYKTTIQPANPNDPIVLSGTHTPIAQKWNQQLMPQHITTVLEQIESAVNQNKKMIIFPESVIPLFLNKQPQLLSQIKELSHHTTIVLGALYLDDQTNRNSTYIFQDGNYTIAHKTILVPFGEGNPLPDWAGEWVNEIFFDGAQDYIAASDITDFDINGTTYRNAICYEATSDKLYQDSPANMVAISNNGWFIPSHEPVIQKILLKFYSKKYGTTIYHSVNMSPSYTVKQSR